MFNYSLGTVICQRNCQPCKDILGLPLIDRHDFLMVFSLIMKYLLLVVIISVAAILLYPASGLSFDLSGIQPTASNGIFSVFAAETVPAKIYSLELSAEQSIEPDYYRLTLKGAYGLTDDFEFLFSLPYVLSREHAGDGFEDFSFALRYRVIREKIYGPSFSLLANAALPSGNAPYTTNGRLGGGIIVSKRIGPFSGHLNVLFSKPGKGSLHNELLFGGGIIFNATHNSWILGEVTARRGPFTTAFDQVEYRIGYRLMTTESIYTTIGAGIDLKNRTPEYRFMVSVNFTKPQKKKIKKIYEEE